jgi:hypothetical protein
MKFQLLIALIMVLVASGMANAMFEPVIYQSVPIQRMLDNLEKLSQQPGISDSDKSMREFQIGRLHAMAYALKTEQGRNKMCVVVDERKQNRELIYRPESPKLAKPELEPNFERLPDYYQFKVTPTTDTALIDASKKHLEQAIQHLNVAHLLAPDSQVINLGLAWCIDQSGNKTEALKLYRKIMKDSWTVENASAEGPAFTAKSLYQEAALYALADLDPATDEQEIKVIEGRVAELSKKPRSITPIVVPLRADLMPRDLMQKADVSFDLDGQGKRRWSQWPSSRAGWLVYVGDGSKPINSGLQLFGQSSFWIFWKDGYDAMASLDDNADGKLTGRELQGLALWCDKNSNGICEPGEVRSLPEFAIVGLSCKKTVGIDGTIFSARGVDFADGTTGNTFDWIVPECKVWN